jgi:hypothetical protein
MRRLLLSLMVLACVATAQNKTLFDEPRTPGRTVWKFSLAALAAANALDVHSSWGKHELNPALAGSGQANFGAQGTLIKAGLQGGLAGVEYLLTRRRPGGRLYRALSVINFGAAAGVGAVAIRNYGVAPPGR